MHLVPVEFPRLGRIGRLRKNPLHASNTFRAQALIFCGNQVCKVAGEASASARRLAAGALKQGIVQSDSDIGHVYHGIRV
jgi:hypothetical protein